MARVLLVISAHGSAALPSEGSESPRRDYLELQRKLQADIVDYDSVEQRWSTRLLRHFAGAAVAQVWLAFRRSANYETVFTDGEHLGIPLALLLRCLRRRPKHVSIGHLLNTPLKRIVFRLLRPHAGFDRVFVHSTLQLQVATRTLGFSSAQLALLPYQADAQFWHPSGDTVSERTICTAGLEYRDYATLLSAVDGLDVELTIAAGSRWSRHEDRTQGVRLPANVRVASELLDYSCLRALYAQSRIVVVPLLPVANQAGITTILEGMAMGRPVIVTATEGQRDVIRGRLCTAAGPAGEPMGGPRAFGVAEHLALAETGLYVPPGDVDALRAAIAYLLDRPQEARRMGAAGRMVVQQAMSVEDFAERIGKVLSAPAGSQEEQPNTDLANRASTTLAGRQNRA